ncbi:SDR family oxidoreductase [Marinovum sp. 2_MG-2023]|uniref:SDR family oxidoreductase n=1 Tax=unclassified Marinovum TaxID=2647166 RepID=UPI0026E2759A|nr:MULTISPECIES: SDR family oxidoreductase [unclassified Marinovum]MDO6731628.1 SDR family oxidoreductase [Marinovum sp. 2_MG-2023]MDO6778246.1 SDR family oxidoreductase [Marinovum sp. 1_MG-2023]
MKRVLIAGATGYLGRHLCAEYLQRGWHVTALVRKQSAATNLQADAIVEAQATWPETLDGIMTDIDLVVSALGITRQADGVGYWDVDYQANVNLLEEAVRSKVPHFAFVHVLNADRMEHVPLVAAKSAFVRKLQQAPLQSTVIAPTGYFSDMVDFLAMARSGRVWLFGPGTQRINPIHGADLAAASFDAIAEGAAWCDVGGPDTFTHNEIAELCFEVLGTPARITHLPDVLRRLTLTILPRIAPRRIAGPAQFFLTAMAMNMTAASTGTHRLAAHFRADASDS